MAASTELSPREVVNALQTLTDDQSKELFFHLGVQLHVLVTIESQHKGNLRKIHFVQAWFDNDLEASWKKISAGLKKIGMGVLAERVASQCSLGAPTSVAVNLPSDPISPPVQTQESGVTQSPATTEPARDPVQPLSVVCTTPPSSTSSSDKVSQAKAAIEQLDDTFSDLMSDARSEMCDKESYDPKFLDKFRDRLLGLPVAKKSSHIKFFRESEDEILEAKNMRKVFAILNRYCSYRNYEILHHLVKKFCEDQLKTRMEEYCESLKRFEMATTINIYLSAISACEDLSLAFIEMTIKVNKPASVCTLHEIRKLKDTLAEKASLHLYSVYIERVSKSSVLVVLRFPVSCIGWILAAMNPDFLHAHHLTEVAVDGECLTIQQGERKQLNIQLFAASERGDVVRVASLLNSGADVETVGGRVGDSALIGATNGGKTEIVVELVKAGANLDLQNKVGNSALMLAAYLGMAKIAVELVKAGANLDLQNKVGNSALMQAAYLGKAKIAVELVKAGANLDLQNKDGDSALIRATDGGKTEIVVELVKAGAKLDLQNKVGNSALMQAAYWGVAKIAVELVKAGANLDLQNKDGDSALMRFATRGETEAVEAVVELVKAGANLDLQDKDGDSALMRAVYLGKTEVVVELVKAGANLDLQNEKGDSAVIIATVGHESGALRELVRAGAALNLQNEEGLTALMISARRGWTELTDILLTGENIDTDIQENSTGWSALFFSAERGNVATTKSLLKSGSNTNLKDKNGLTALEVAAASADKEWCPYKVRYFDRVCELLTQHIQESTTLHCHPETSATVQDSTPTHQDSSTVSQDRLPTNQDRATTIQATRQGHVSMEISTTGQDSTLTHQDSSTVSQDRPPTNQDSSTVSQDRPPTNQDTATTVQATPTTRQGRVSVALRNLANRSGQRIQQIFSQLDRRLKSADKKNQTGMRGEGKDRVQRDQDRPRNNEGRPTTSTAPVV